MSNATRASNGELVRDIIDRTQRCAEANRQDYRRDNSIDLNLRQDELTSLSLVLKVALDKFGIAMMHDKIVRDDRNEPFHPNSHVGKIVDLAKRVDGALHGRKMWNRGR